MRHQSTVRSEMQLEWGRTGQGRAGQLCNTYPSADGSHGGVCEALHFVAIADAAVVAALVELGDAAEVVGAHGLAAGTSPSEAVAVGQNSREQSRAVGAPDAHHQNADAPVRPWSVRGIRQEHGARPVLALPQVLRQAVVVAVARHLPIHRRGDRRVARHRPPRRHATITVARPRTTRQIQPSRQRPPLHLSILLHYYYVCVLLTWPLYAAQGSYL
jgi:hypothetical protein